MNKKIKFTTKATTGADVVAECMRQINPDVVAAYPISPQSPMMHQFAKSVADGIVDTELITVESEHSAMSACVGASAAGARVMTATAANGLALMTEIVYIASSMRLPLLMNVGNRALSGPINIHADHSDSMLVRNSGWMQFYAETPQDVYDLNYIGLKIAENPKVLTPIMVCQDGYLTTHTMQEVTFMDDKFVKNWIGTYHPVNPLLNVNKPVTKGPFDLYDYYFEHKRQQMDGLENAKKVAKEVFKKYEEETGRHYWIQEEFMLEDAEVAIVVMNSTAGTAKSVVKKLREQGVKAGVLKIVMFRPFFHEEVAFALRNCKAVAVLDRVPAFGSHGGPLFYETRSALYNYVTKPKIVNYLYGLGGREINSKMITEVYEELLKIKKTGQVDLEVKCLGSREGGEQ